MAKNNETIPMDEIFNNRPLKKQLIAIVPSLSLSNITPPTSGVCILRPDSPDPLRLHLAANLPASLLFNQLESLDYKNSIVVVTKFSKVHFSEWVELRSTISNYCKVNDVPIYAVNQGSYRSFFLQNRPDTATNFKESMKTFRRYYYAPEFQYLLRDKTLLDAFALAKCYEFIQSCGSYADRLLGNVVTL